MSGTESDSSRAQLVTIDKLREGPWLQIGQPNGFEWNKVTLPVRSLPDGLQGLRILHLTDLHLGASWASAYDELLERVAADPPDLILLTGDLVEHKFDHRPALPTAQRLVCGLRSRHGIYGILGNHDGDLLGAVVEGWGLRLINGRFAPLTINGAAVELIGLPGVHRDDLKGGFLGTVPRRQPDTLRVVLSHYPDAIRKMGELHPDLFLAGHTHAGQICLPGGIPLFTHDSLPRRMAQGVHRTHDTWLVVGRGFGFSGWRVRVFCPSEVVEVVVRKG